jgi:translation initiation factor 2-alpha kinase 4
MKFSTSMERSITLSALRSANMVFPSNWPIDKSDQREIVTWLLRHDPVMRPRAAQLLTSPLLPSPEKQKEYYDTAIAGELVGGVTLLC